MVQVQGTCLIDYCFLDALLLDLSTVAVTLLSCLHYFLYAAFRIYIQTSQSGDSSGLQIFCFLRSLSPRLHSPGLCYPQSHTMRIPIMPNCCHIEARRDQEYRTDCQKCLGNNADWIGLIVMASGIFSVSTSIAGDTARQRALRATFDQCRGLVCLSMYLLCSACGAA